MRTLSQLSGLLLAGLIVCPAGISKAHRFDAVDGGSVQLLARGGGRGGGGRGGGGGRMGGGGGGAHRAGTGFASAGGGLDRGSVKPSGGWSDRAGGGKVRPSMDRPALQRDLGQRDLGRGDLGSRDRQVNRSGSLNRDGSLSRDGVRNLNGDRNLTGDRNLAGDRTINRNIDRNLNRNIDRNVNRNWGRDIDVRDVNLYPGWARPGWGVARPWNYGWYGGWSNPTWGWWGARAAAWGIGTLATAAIINDAVDNAVESQASYIVVPNSTYQLLYGTVQPIGTNSVGFDVTADGSTYHLTADCTQGLLNGAAPNTAAEAELLNAACQVAFGQA